MAANPAAEQAPKSLEELSLLLSNDHKVKVAGARGVLIVSSRIYLLYLCRNRWSGWFSVLRRLIHRMILVDGVLRGKLMVSVFESFCRSVS